MLNRLSAWFGTRPKTMEGDDVKLPPDLPNWSIVKELLQDLQVRLISESISEQETGWFMQTIYSTIQSERQFSGTKDSHLNRLKLQIQSNFKKKLDHSSLWFGMLKYVRNISRDERDKFLYSTLPNMIGFALGIEANRPKTPLIISRQQNGGSTELSRQFVCSVVACFFLCLFPERKRESTKMNIVNFTTFFKYLPNPAQVAKLQCILHYFDCVVERGMELHGNIIFCRKVALPSWMLTFDELVQCNLKLCSLNIQPEGAIEDSGTDAVQVCFGNKSVGGGVLGRSVVQEEIRFSSCPELMAAMLFMENMETNEAILVSGFQQFSTFSGYGDSLQFTGHYTGPDQYHVMVTMDALSYREISASKQYEEPFILRDLNKAVIGFSWMPGTDGGTVVSGKGCDSPVAVDVAADIVTTAMSDALRQAAESPVDPESHQPPCQLFQHPYNQQNYSSQSHQQGSEDHLAATGTSLQERFNLVTTTEPAADSTFLWQDTSRVAGPCSADLQTAQSKLFSSDQSPSSCSQVSVRISSDSTLVPQPQSCVDSMTEAATTALNCSAQMVFHRSQSSHYQRQLLKQPVSPEHEEKQIPRIAAHSLAKKQLIKSSSSADSDRVPHISADIEATLESGTFVRYPQLWHSAMTHPGSGRKLVCDVLGNLSKLAKPLTGLSSVKSSPFQQDTPCELLQDTGWHKFDELSQHESTMRDSDKTADVRVASRNSSASYTPPLMDESQDVKILTGDKCEDVINSIDVVLSLPAIQSELEGSGLSNSSVVVNVGSQSPSANSAEEENDRQSATEVLYINVENIELSVGTCRYDSGKLFSEARPASIDSVLLEPPFSSSPQSSVSSANISPNTSFLIPESFHLEPPNGFSDVHISAEFLEGLNSQAQQSSRRGSRDFYGELRDFLNSSSSGSRSSGSSVPLSSTNSSWGSRSGSISSHGTNGSTIDFPEFWNHFRRRSSQLSDTMSRRSSSSKHSSDFSTDLEEISEGLQKHNHGVIEEEGSFMSLLADFALHFVSVAVRSGVTVGAHLTSSGGHVRAEDEMGNSRLSSEISHQQHPKSGLEVMPSICQSVFAVKTATAKTDESFLILSHQVGDEQPDKLPLPELLVPSFGQEGLIAEDNGCEHTEPDFPSSVRSSTQFTSVSSRCPTPPAPVMSQSLTSLRGQQLRNQPSLSHHFDSGFSSAISSVTSHHTTIDYPSEETSSISTSGTKLDDLSSLTATVATHPLTAVVTHHLAAVATCPLTTVATHPVTTVAVSQVDLMTVVADSLSVERLELNDNVSKSTTVRQSIPLSPVDDKTLYATLESKTICLGANNLPQSTWILHKEKPIERIQTESASCEMKAPLLPLQEKKESYLKPNCDAAKKFSRVPKNTSTADGAGDVWKRGLKYLRRQTTVDEAETQPRKVNHVARDPSRTAEAFPNSSLHVDHHSFSASSSASLIPRVKDSIKRWSACSVSSGSKSQSHQKHISLSDRDRLKAGEERKPQDGVSSSRRGARIEKTLLKPHKSRYVFSDVAAPICVKRKKVKTAESEASMSKHNEKKTLKKQDEKKRKQKEKSSRQNHLDFTRSPKFIRFVSSIAEMSVSQAVLTGAEMLTQSSRGSADISDELYNWFATKIVTEVFLYVIKELDMQHGSHTSQLGEDDQPEGPQRQLAGDREIDRAETTVPKPIIFPARSDAPTYSSAPLGSLRPSVSLKVVKFIDSQGEGNISLAASHVQTLIPTKNNTTSTFHRQSSSIPVPIRRRSSLDLPPPSSSSSSLGATSLPSSRSPFKFTSAQHNPPSLTSKDLSLDIYQAAAVIVSQVFQAVSDSFVTNSPVSSGRLDTTSSPDTAAHSTGSRVHSNYNSIASNIFSSSSLNVSESPKRLHAASPSIGVFSRKPMSRETLTNAFLKVDSTPSIKSYERRSSEPCQTSVQLSLQAFNSIKFSKQAVEDKQRKISRTDDDIGRGKTWRRSSLDGFSFERRHSCGFKDPVLSRFAEELMKADTSVPELVIVGSHPSSTSTGSRRSSGCAHRESGQANVESELLNTSFTSVCSLAMSHSSHSQCRRAHMDRSRSRESRNWKSDSSDTEYWFPPPKIVGDEFQQEYNRQHSQEELQDYASFFAGRVVQEAVCVLKCDPEYMTREELDLQLFAENLMDQIMRDALTASKYDGPSSNQRERGDSRQSSRSQIASMLTSDSGDAKHITYHVEGARQKTSVWRRSKTKVIPRKRDMRREGREQDCERTGDSSDSSRHGGHRERRASTSAEREKLPSPSYHAHSQSIDLGLQSSGQDSFFHQSVQTNTADLRLPSSKHTRHSTPDSLLSSTLSPAARPPLISHRVQPGMSHCQRHSQRTRSRLNPAASSASSIPVYKGSFSRAHQKTLSKAHKDESDANSASSVSSYHSEQTESSLQSSSGSESIGPTGNVTPSRKQRGRRELEYHKASSGHEERPRGRDSYARRADHVNSKKTPDKDRALHSKPGLQQCPTIEKFATSLSIAVMDSALVHCRDNRWLRFLTYHKPIATGNWGCGAFRGNAQLKLVIQWIAASLSQAPSLLYFTYSDGRLVQAQEIASLISEQTVGHLATALRDYCSWVHLYLASISASFCSSSARPHHHHHRSLQQTGMTHSAWQGEHDSQLPQTLFDFLIEKFREQGNS